MNDLLAIIIIERKTIIRDLLLCFFLIFPFTFLPILIKDGFNLESIQNRIPVSILYALGFSLLILIVSVLDNYKKLFLKKKIYDFPAFKSLDFQGRIEGLNSVVYDISTFLLGEFNGYYFRINAEETNENSVNVEIAPFIDLSDDETFARKIKKELGLSEDLFLYKKMKIESSKLNDENYLKNALQEFSDKLMHVNVKPAEINYKELWN